MNTSMVLPNLFYCPTPCGGFFKSTVSLIIFLSVFFYVDLRIESCADDLLNFDSTPNQAD